MEKKSLLNIKFKRVKRKRRLLKSVTFCYNTRKSLGLTIEVRLSFFLFSLFLPKKSML
ncbi:hypothetical protein HAN_3g373 (nucleomorph) [Hemiselmis andersenii]|uniref:Uncharacterized protein n=1 Tax=Hemiselmis andersenii TaxID=464988 RepID=A9BK23_HEMAN|nr:hypothetical protein HAN_1g8 [Hemiselmis andersenii]XP_001712336.1 hypothetical protein HAN_1g176 [Hemiselmis andersenii]XP_001712509.1 hypothetical protein HAN_3g373 [Hemiselmis andersenii]ABW97856.1 hypothetical protein HAN_1g8 [Hemiselmis andersenii]ABW98011.1 hypothetical protein HAN_1g176 [Hemiselmis andersenii]ABW98184.1 hypothetical protein HAN_3g373 [Hemiselmis andersenii]